MIILEEIRQKLIEALKTSGMKQTDIAKKVCVSQPNIANYLSGKTMPSLDTFANLCVLLDLDANEILNIRK